MIVHKHLEEMAKDWGGAVRIAERLNISEPYLSLVLSGQKPPSDRVVRVLGLRRVVR